MKARCRAGDRVAATLSKSDVATSPMKEPIIFRIRVFLMVSSAMKNMSMSRS